jgi:hypothetical protein
MGGLSGVNGAVAVIITMMDRPKPAFADFRVFTSQV